ncbi:MAG: PHP-associated domain-containing protein [Syntrophales bacterium]|nr:PHP-associated domain-containing protein [Syntrophales bacterium]
MSMREFRCDFHIHTCLSPCAELDMYPRALISRSIEADLDVIGICDHNASENVKYTIEAARGTSVKVFPGMEVTSREEVHLIALFDNTESLVDLQKIIYLSLPGTNDEAVFGCQAIVNDRDEVEGFNERLLIGSTTLSINDIVHTVHRLEGIIIAAHIDRESFGIIGQLGFIPDNVHLDALEVSYRTGISAARNMYPELANHSFISSSDAHRLEDIGRTSTILRIREPSVKEFKMAFERHDGRAIVE